MSKIENVSRRDVLRAGGGVFVLATTLSACGQSETGVPEAIEPAAKALSKELEDLNLFVAINEEGAVRIMCHRAEMGQHARTGMARVIADELEADWDKIDVVQTEGTDKFGDQNTDGSTTIRADFTRLRRIGASARSMLEQAAATEWGVPVGECKAMMHEVVHEASGRKLGYGALAAAAAALDAPAYEGEALAGGAEPTYRLKSPSEFRYIGKATPSIDLDAMLVGKAVYGQDLTRPGMKYAVIARSPVLYGKVVSFDADAARATPGVVDVMELPIGDRKGGFNPLGGVAVIAENTWAAIEGRNALSIEW
ncbi:MAG: molybdopterin cofactor-binding domain-containing protein, partial [Pseudomonadota bacterium]